MIEWSENVRSNDNGYFCRMAVDMYDQSQCLNILTIFRNNNVFFFFSIRNNIILDHSKDIWIISDARRKTDIVWFKSNFSNVKLIRITADECTRKERGWSFIEGINKQN